MLIKVCGMQSAEQVNVLDESADLIGFIFYDRSPRFVESTPTVKYAKKVGVFVNAPMDIIIDCIEKNNLDCVQLHGNESPECCAKLQGKVEVIKAFGVDDSFSFDAIETYESSVDYFLFDTKTPHHGGSGRQFKWDILSNYRGSVPFLLSGGIRPDSIEDLTQFSHPKFVGIDLNSGFEHSPGDKNLKALTHFMEQIKN